MTIQVKIPDNHSPKHPDGVRWYKLKWATHLASISDTIATSVWSVPTGITAVTDDIVDANTNTRIKVSGGKSGIWYDLKNTITTTTSTETIPAIIRIKVDDDPNNVT